LANGFPAVRAKMGFRPTEGMAERQYALPFPRHGMPRRMDLRVRKTFTMAIKVKLPCWTLPSSLIIPLNAGTTLLPVHPYRGILVLPLRVCRPVTDLSSLLRIMAVIDPYGMACPSIVLLRIGAPLTYGSERVDNRRCVYAWTIHGPLKPA
jgi:hypothetical protein